jgi:hypothetical protein
MNKPSRLILAALLIALVALGAGCATRAITLPAPPPVRY